MSRPSGGWLAAPALLLAAALLGLGAPRGLADAADAFTPAQSEAARQGVVETLEAAVTAAAGQLGDVDLPPYIKQSQRKVAFVTVTNSRVGSNIKMHVGPLRLVYPPGLDPVVQGQDVNFTLPLRLDAPYITGDLEHKVNDVGPTGHFNTTLGQVQLEAEGAVRVAADACTLSVRGVKDTAVGDVSTVVEGANVLNPVLAKEMSDAVRDDLVSWKQAVLPAVLAALQKEAEKQACVTNVRARLAKVPAA